MKATRLKEFDVFAAILKTLGKNAFPRPPDLRQEQHGSGLFSAGQMQQHGKFLAEKHCIQSGQRRGLLLDRLSQNETLLFAAHHLLTQSAANGRKHAPAVDWFLDNFYLIKENIQTEKRHFPKSYNSQLPHLSNGNSAGLPRVYDLALEAITHGDGRFDLDNLYLLVNAYQDVMPLQLGELWAIPLMLRLALLENITQVAVSLSAHRIARDLADLWADRMLNDLAQTPQHLILTVADMVRSQPPMTGSFVATLTSRLQSQNSALALLFSWLEQWLATEGFTVEDLVNEDLQRQAADQVSMGNSIEGLRCLGSVDWHKFVENTSIVEAVLKLDPADIYRAMDFETRDKYRHVVETLAFRNPTHSEKDVASAALHLAQTARDTGAPMHLTHLGYYLIDAGLPALRAKVNAPSTVIGDLKKSCGQAAFALYVGSISGVLVLSSVYFMTVAYGSGLNDWGLWVIGILALLGTTNLAVAIVNCPAMLLAAPRTLPRMDFTLGIPSQFRTLVVIPTIFNSKSNIDELAKSLEIAFLANRDDGIHFGLLTDFCDAPTPTLPDDEALLQFAQTAIAKLNSKYPKSDGTYFFLFHRPRLWNPQEGVWMGFERKRGKLADLNRLLRGRSNGSFESVVGDASILQKIKYVITLDTDTLLPREAARQFIETMAHPLNQPRYDRQKMRVTGGYGVLQPRVTMSLSGMNKSLYARMYTNEWGIDPYTRSVSDVYQDLFDEGSFIGKGIYDVDIFDQVLGERFPDNRILSHDLLEGCYIRAGLLSDVPLYEEYPASYHDDVNRRRRWIRGDWQVAYWVLPRVPGADGKLVKNPLSRLSRWKLADNLLRSLAAPALFLLLFFGWATLPFFGWWTLGLFGIVLTPSLLATTLNLFQKSDEITLRQHFDNILGAMLRRFFLSVFAFMCLPYEAFYSLQSIVHASWRMSFSHRKLLEWKSPGGTGNPRGDTLWGSFQIMWVVPCITLMATVLFAVFRPELLAAALPVLLLWLAAPVAVWRLSLPISKPKKLLSVGEAAFLRREARKIWAYFADFTGPEDHYLPPDNIQEYPDLTIAHRTSPTNIGLALLANLAAYDFGAIAAGALLERCDNTLKTMQKLDRIKGHFYNWYDTKTLKPLPVYYVSTVDSGNLSGHLHVLRMGLLELPDRKIIRRKNIENLADTVDILSENAQAAGDATGQPAIAQLQAELRQWLTTSELTLTTLQQLLTKLANLSADLQAQLNAASQTAAEPVKYWARAFDSQCLELNNELKFLAPWLEHNALASLLADYPGLDEIPTLHQIGELCDTFTPQTVLPGGLRHFIDMAAGRAAERIAAVGRLAGDCENFARMDYRFLYDPSRHLLAIGCNVGEMRPDINYYDLLASESRLATFTAIAQGQLPQKSWFALSRLLTIVDGRAILLSWSGSMFEYLMPLLVMPGYKHTLLADSCEAAVEIQIAYGSKRHVPWGISECGYNAVDAQNNYQYRAFGVPGLGLKRGLADDLVIAPYASMLALLIAPQAACENLQRLKQAGLAGQYGFYEAIDYTPHHLPYGHTQKIVKSFMVHHQGMSLLALDSVLCDQPMQRRFAADPAFGATLMLLQERVPKATAFYAYTTEVPEFQSGAVEELPPLRIYHSPETAAPALQLLSNGKYHVMINNAGSGYSHWTNLAVTRWSEDPVCDGKGLFCYLRDVDTKAVWSAAYQPVCQKPESFETVFSDGRAKFKRLDHAYEVCTEIAVSPEDDVELRQIKITNRASVTRSIDVTSYAEIVLAPPASDAAHPAFSNLFVETEIIGEETAVLCSRRPRGQNQERVRLFHLMAAHGGKIKASSCETDRLHFIGRGRTLADPVAVTGQANGDYADDLAGHEGAVLDPIVAIRCRITLAPGETGTVNLVSGIAPNRDDALRLTRKYRDKHLAERVFELAWTHEQVLLRQLNTSSTDAQLYMRLAGMIIYADPALRAEPEVIAKNKRGQSGLWGHAISGDLPIVLLQIGNPIHIDLARQLVQAHAYWHLKGLAVDLVIWNEDAGGYRQILDEQISGLIASGIENNVTNRPGGIFLRNNALLSEEDRILIQACARVIISDRRGTLADQITGRAMTKQNLPPLYTVRAAPAPAPALPAADRPPRMFDNGTGGFSPDGREYQITVAPGRVPPAPWINVLANPSFGTIVSESGQSSTWSGNAHEFRITPWENDPVCDTGGEAFYLRDEETGVFWSPTPFPAAAGETRYVVRHGFGYTVFESAANELACETIVYVAAADAVKFTVIKLRNQSNRVKKLSVTGYAELVLGELRPKTAMHVITETDRATGSVFAGNRYNPEFRRTVVFFDADSPDRSITCDRLEFLGRHGSLRRPAAMTRARLSGKVGAALDPCVAIRVPFELAPGEARQIVFRLGCGNDTDEARTLVKRYREPGAPETALDTVKAQWDNILGGVKVKTPDAALDVLVNGWLLYQTVGCRIWARNAKYQSGGAFGFRDQLQDMLALLHARPELVREHLLVAAGHQFGEGDVMHWWHPPLGRGVRTHCSDDYLWLPFTVCRYVAATGDTGVLDEKAPFLKGRALAQNEDSYYDLPDKLDQSATLYEHCQKSIRYGLKFGTHHLPLMGTGDWNDGMNLVGEHGQGESVWLGFFLYDVLQKFAVLAKKHDDIGFAELCLAQAETLGAELELHGWDGSWYRRAYFDSGLPLGSKLNVECRIDSISQSWSVLSGVGSPRRCAEAMDNVYCQLVGQNDRVIRLLTPPFDRSSLEPGYIKGYVPGVRENGGQYTHAAIWAAMAFAKMGDTLRAWELFQMINPVNHGRTPEEVAVYKVEPYVMAADVYAVEPHTGRGGWSWYTGSSGWMYQLILESLLGVSIEVDKLKIQPCLPADWPGFELDYRYRKTYYHICVRRRLDGQVSGVTVDGVKQPGMTIALINDCRAHHAEVVTA